jgi:predicted ATP-dependent protease
MQILKYDELGATVPLSDLPFKTTEQLVGESSVFQPHVHGWVAQAEAKKAAMFGLNMPQSGFNLLVLGEHGSGRTSLMLSAMAQVSNKADNQLHDLIALFDFEQTNQPVLIKLPVGLGAKLREEMGEFMRLLMMELPNFALEKTQQAMLDKAEPWLEASLQVLNKSAEGNNQLKRHIFLMKCDVVAYLKTWQLPISSELEGPLEGLVNEAYLARFRVNLLVDNRVMQSESLNQPLVYDNDPSHQSLFGWLESAPDSPPDFLRLRAGNLHKADGGILLLHLRDLLNDEQNGSQVIEKLYRFLRNGTLQFEDSTSSAHSTGYVLSNTLLPLKVKLVLIAMREDFYSLLEESPDFFDYFPIKVEFASSVNATAENYAAVAGFVAQKCAQHNCQHFSADAVVALIGALQRLEEDQSRISTNFAFLERLMLESASCAGDLQTVSSEHVQAAIIARNQRHQYFETQIRESITDNELLIQVEGKVVGQVNGLTHVELADASFGSPIRITARCYPGQKGLINIDREVNMSGPNHDKGIFILQNWLSASFSHLAPLSLNASLVFEQEYSGVEGDSASCAELFALLSALANLPVQQGIAITGALNQFGEVMPIGGVNEKIEGFFRVCKALGLNGKQGVIIPKRNQRHLLLDDEVVNAVKNGQFHIIAINHVLEGIEHLADVEAGEKDASGHYAPDTVMGHAQAVLAEYRKTLESNRPQSGNNTK